VHDVFISYSRGDAPAAEEVARKLTEAGCTVFLDSGGLVSESSWSKQVNSALLDSRAVVALLSANSRDSTWARAEVQAALQAKKLVVPVLLDKDARDNWVWPLVATRRAIEIYLGSPQAESQFDELLHALRQIDAPMRLYLSSRFDWLRAGHYKTIRQLAARHGFRVVDPAHVDTHSDLSWLPSSTVAENLLVLLRASSAFLQVIPLQAASELQWLIFELGAARSLNLPLAICAETNESVRRDEETTTASWEMTLQVVRGSQLHAFDAGSPDSSLTVAVTSALADLEQQIRSRKGAVTSGEA
jgi:hypothetical protein